MTPDPKELRELAQYFSWTICGGQTSTPQIEAIHAALMAFADHLEAERWISVTERLPEEPGAYLCVIIYRHGRYRAVAIWRGKTWEIDRRVDLNDTVTHWSPLRPLPEPPEKP